MDGWHSGQHSSKTLFKTLAFFFFLPLNHHIINCYSTHKSQENSLLVLKSLRFLVATNTSWREQEKSNYEPENYQSPSQGS